MNNIYDMEVFADSTVKIIKNQICILYGLIMNKQKMFYKNIELENDKKLSFYKIKNEDLIFCIIIDI